MARRIDSATPQFREFLRIIAKNGVPRPEIRRLITEHPEGDQNGAPAAAGRTANSQRDWQHYLSDMRRSMAPKKAQLITLLPHEGLYVDFCCGSGDQTFSYADSYPHLFVVGVDMAAESLQQARERFRLPNLLFLQGNAREPLFPAGSVSAAGDSSGVHEIYSYSGFSKRAIQDYFGQIFRMLKPGGRYGSRDFAIPPWPKTVRIHLPTTAEHGPGPYGKLSRAALFERYAQRFKNPVYPQGVPYTEIPSERRGFRIFETDRIAAANFILRMEYRVDFEAELKELYLYHTQEQRRDELEKVGLRVDYSAPVNSTWIYLNWWKNRLAVTDTNDRPLDLPYTNSLVYSTRPGPKDPVGIEVTSTRESARRHADLLSFRDARNGDAFDMVHFPDTTALHLPYEMNEQGQVIAYVERQAERPERWYYGQNTNLPGVYYSGFGAAALDQLLDHQAAKDPLPHFLESLSRAIDGKGRKSKPKGVEVLASSPYLASPGMSDETVSPFAYRISPAIRAGILDDHFQGIELNQLIAACHVGAIPDGRLEDLGYSIADKYGVPLDPWFDGYLPFTDQPRRKVRIAPQYPAVKEITLGQDPRRLRGNFLFHPDPTHFTRNLHLRFRRHLANGQSSSFRRQFLIPRRYSLDTFVVLPYFKAGQEVFVGFEPRCLPSFEIRGFGSSVWVLPAWRLPGQIKDRTQSVRFLNTVMDRDFGIKSLNVTPLGEGWFPNRDPEKITPLAVEVDTRSNLHDLPFVPLERVLEELPGIPDLHTRVALRRFKHNLSSQGT